MSAKLVLWTLIYAVREISGSTEDALVGPSIHKSEEEALMVLWGFVRHRISPAMKDEFLEAASDLNISEFATVTDPLNISQAELEVIFSHLSLASIKTSIDWYFEFMHGSSNDMDCFYQIDEHLVGDL